MSSAFGVFFLPERKAVATAAAAFLFALAEERRLPLVLREMMDECRQAGREFARCINFPTSNSYCICLVDLFVATVTFILSIYILLLLLSFILTLNF